MKKLTKKEIKLYAKVWSGVNLEHVVGVNPLYALLDYLELDQITEIGDEIVNIGNKLRGNNKVGFSPEDILKRLFPEKF